MNHTPRTEAVQHPGLECQHFLRHIDIRGTAWGQAPMGLNAVNHTVVVLSCENHSSMRDHTVVLKLATEGFQLQEYLTPEEARTLARALNLAADHAQERAEAAQADDWLASNAAAQKLCGVVA